ncbi:hypothetical protein CPB84DRAFT_1764116 [Gymnopilus junonius]|uniref:F-box domain-containing protein n=1 Tax=Gymnopilus junonius TaxID=109634 RepID=A0A9P5TTD9_GYMJU|nr:hypothetical protein CPB84DRAFT_1764116 [Gymnopilus junonius]
MQDIPYDVWLHITSFLSPEEVSNLYTLNSSLLGIALDARYRMAFIGSLNRRSTERSLNRLTDPMIAPRVRSLTFRPGHLCKLLQDSERQKQKQLLENPVSELLKAFESLSIQSRRKAMTFNESPMPAHFAKKNALKIMSLLTSLTSLRVEIRGEEHWYFGQSPVNFFAPGWMAFKDNLTSLDLIVPLEDMAKILPPARDTLLSLTALSFRIIRATLTTDIISIVMETLVPFINKHHRTLKTLQLDVAEQVSMSPLLLNLTHLTSLSSFKMKQPLVSQEELDFAGLKHFFQTHRSHLSTLDIGMVATYIYYPTPFPFFSHDCFTVSFPRLQHLIIHLHDFPLEYLEGMIPFVSQFHQTLVSLEVQGHDWPFTNLDELLQGLSSASNLRELKIHVFLFSPFVLFRIAKLLSKLETLCLGFSEVGPSGFIDLYEEIPLFVHEMEQYRMEQLVFSAWHLRSLHLEKALHVSHDLRQRYKLALVQALPNVETFCGLPKIEYISTTVLV